MEVKTINEIINNDVVNTFKIVLLIDETGKQIGNLPSNAALAIAYDRGFDLVCVAPGMATPVCKLLDYGKFKYEQQRKAKLNKKNSVKHETKEIQIRYGIAAHDMEIKARSVKKFLEDGDSVRVVMRLNGREQTMIDYAKEKFLEFLGFCGEYSVKKDLFQEGRDLKIFLEKVKDK